MQQDVVTVGVDLAKNVFQVHAIGADGKVGTSNNPGVMGRKMIHCA